MDDTTLQEEIKEKVGKLAEKYEAMGQDMLSYLDGLLYARSLTYWDYVELDTLLSLQKPRTDFPDENIFICYHQITELYFKLIKLELAQIVDVPGLVGLAEWKKRIKRILNYYYILTHSFGVMVEGMDPEQFLKFRMALLPASGFQSIQYRELEILCTDLRNLVSHPVRDVYTENSPLSEIYDQLYWKYGNLELKTGRKTLTLRMFEEKYDRDLLEMAAKYRTRNLWKLYNLLTEEERQDEELRKMMKELDIQANVFWPLSHYKSAVRYLDRAPEIIEATGGTNWQKYLPPRFQHLSFFPDLWTEEEKKDWGKAWVISVFKEQVESHWTPDLNIDS
jgi:tryptophan 2,3-dioxygenase